MTEPLVYLVSQVRAGFDELAARALAAEPKRRQEIFEHRDFLIAKLGFDPTWERI